MNSNGKSTRYLHLLLVAASLLALTAPSIAADPTATEVPVPCTPDSSTPQGGGLSSAFLRKCSEVITSDGSNGVPEGMAPLLDDHMKKLIDDPTNSLYAGGYTDGSETVKTGKPVCDLMPTLFNKNIPEADSNHRGESCGTPAQFNIQTHKGGYTATMVLGAQYGTLEYSYLWGLKTQSQICFWNQVKNEIQKNQSVKVSSYCDAQAKALISLQAQANTVINSLTQQLGTLKNASEIWKCDPKMFGNNGQSYNSNVPIQAAMKLCDARANIETAFLNFAVCEVEQRSDQAFRHFAWNADSFIDQLKNNVSTQVRQECSHSCDSCKSYGCCNTAAGNCTNGHYKAALQQFMQGILAKVPNNGACTLGTPGN